MLGFKVSFSRVTCDSIPRLFCCHDDVVRVRFFSRSSATLLSASLLFGVNAGTVVYAKPVFVHLLDYLRPPKTADKQVSLLI